MLAGIVFGLILMLVLGTFAYAFATLPDPSRLDLTGGDIQIFDRNNHLIEQRNAQGVRVIPVELKDISPNLRNATIAVEDRHFYQHHGVDWGRVIKAGVIDDDPSPAIGDDRLVRRHRAYRPSERQRHSLHRRESDPHAGE